MFDSIPEELVRLSEPETTVRYEPDPATGTPVATEVELFAFAYRPCDVPKVAKRILAWLPEDQSMEFFLQDDMEDTRAEGTIFRLKRNGERWQLADDQREHGIADIDEGTAIWWLNHCLPSNTGPHPRCIEVHPHSGEEWTSEKSADPLKDLIRDTMMAAMTAGQG